MAEGEPIPINRGVEIQKKKIDKILSWATASYRELAELSHKVESRLDAELAKDPVTSDLEKVQILFEQKHALKELGHEIENLILRNFSNQDELARRLRGVQDQMAHAKEAITANDNVS